VCRLIAKLLVDYDDFNLFHAAHFVPQNDQAPANSLWAFAVIALELAFYTGRVFV